MRIKRHLHLIVMLLTGLWGCAVDPTNRENEQSASYQSMHEIDQPSGYELKATVKPCPWENAQVHSTSMESRSNDKQCDYYFLVGISYNDFDLLSTAGTKKEYDELLDLLLFKMGNYVSLTTDIGDTLALDDYIFARVSGKAKYSELLFAFERSHTDFSSVTLTVGECCGNFKKSFVFSKSDLIDNSGGKY